MGHVHQIPAFHQGPSAFPQVTDAACRNVVSTAPSLTPNSLFREKPATFPQVATLA